MTIINVSELGELTTLDQLIMWSIVSINASNLDVKNEFISDNAAIRAESKDYIAWSVTQDDKGKGRFIFSALLPMSNPNPLQDKRSILERILSYSPWNPDLDTEGQIAGYGWPMPNIPVWVDSTEQLLAYAATIATRISKWARMTKLDDSYWSGIYPEYWASCQYQINDTPYGGTMVISGYLTIDWNKYLQGESLLKCLNPYFGRASNVSCNFPDLAILWGLGSVDVLAPIEQIQLIIPTTGVTMLGEDTAEGLIDSYGGNSFLDEAVPDWYKDAMDGYQDRAESFNNTSNDIGNATPKVIESLTVCKEQDSSMSSYAISLADKVAVN